MLSELLKALRKVELLNDPRAEKIGNGGMAVFERRETEGRRRMLEGGFEGERSKCVTGWRGGSEPWNSWYESGGELQNDDISRRILIETEVQSRTVVQADHALSSSPPADLKESSSLPSGSTPRSAVPDYLGRSSILLRSFFSLT